MWMVKNSLKAGRVKGQRIIINIERTPFNQKKYAIDESVE